MGKEGYKKLNVLMYVETYKSLKEYSERSSIPMVKVIIKALNFSINHIDKFKKFLQWYVDFMAGDITTLRTFSVSEVNHKRIKTWAEKLDLSMSMWIDSAVAFYLRNIEQKV
ncbi:hypothetical protein APY94_06310 [Thermococcus celericrescens]|uniref:Uncharacterized protein n=1 Tax=Thermococcus celericrescens TaxID=227598 RepID=A0A100XXQ3_9EURY|nr:MULTISPECIES: hypothetical protein [Thermococcaceae]KUH33346.1 hypothetical protein APY94_06310 [Thermococcus celericrescens]